MAAIRPVPRAVPVTRVVPFRRSGPGWPGHGSVVARPQRPSWPSEGVPGHRAGHAARAAPAAAELGPGDPDDLDTGRLQRLVGDRVPLVGHREPRRQGEGVVPVVPLLTL